MPNIGAIADDLTGATDLANNLVDRGFRTVVEVGLPPGNTVAHQDTADAVVIALKSRTNPVPEAVRDSLTALAALRAAGCERFYFKYCSTFDSTPRGNIGPVAAALLDALGEEQTIFCPSFPANGRTVYQGHLFVGSQLLSESSMRHHPLTPMNDSSVVRLLAAQTTAQVGLITLDVVRAGADQVRARLDHLRESGTRMVVVDAIDEADLVNVAAGSSRLRLVTGGSGLALGLTGPHVDNTAWARALDVVDGPSVILSGSASEATRRQVSQARAALPSRKLSLPDLRHDFTASVGELVSLARANWSGTPVMIYATDSLADLSPASDTPTAVGEPAAELVERVLSTCAVRLAEAGARRFVVAGGESSGAVIRALGLHSLLIGPQITPGVAWCTGQASGETYNVALKSGNFGDDDFFTAAWKVLQ
jgi:uncharacterized protein YgbK (DUF1537 family)